MSRNLRQDYQPLSSRPVLYVHIHLYLLGFVLTHIYFNLYSKNNMEWPLWIMYTAEIFTELIPELL